MPGENISLSFKFNRVMLDPVDKFGVFALYTSNRGLSNSKYGTIFFQGNNIYSKEFDVTGNMNDGFTISNLTVYGSIVIFSYVPIC